MTIRLRPHHLLCLLTYVGRGYTPAFTANYDAIAGRVAQGEDILIIEGPDDICAPLLGELEPHCLRSRVVERDGLAARDLSGLLSMSICPGKRITFDADLLLLMREAFSSGQIRNACSGCQWFALCNSVAANKYAKTIVSPFSLKET